MRRPVHLLVLAACLAASVLTACHAGPRIEAAAREVQAEQQAEQQARQQDDQTPATDDAHATGRE